ncbi:tail protein [Desulfofustis phage LS06-2018-MD02]|jgi:hypothetical protein|nr:tail protein [Desulfofustis phage LS06-2018-MD02]
MAGFLLAGVGAAIGSIGGGFTFLGISSVVIGQSIGAVIGSAIDNYLFAPTIKSSQEGPKLNEANVMTSVEGANLVRGYGRFKVAGNLIWATRLREEVVKETTKAGGKGGGGGGSEVTTTTYNYYANFAVGLCEGEILDVHRIWADGKLIDLSQYTYRIYKGTETQTPDSYIEQKEGEGNVPAYRGLAYVVFEDIQINKFGNRIPQMTFEVTRRVTRSDNDAVGDLVTGICLIPGTIEFGYDPNRIIQKYEDGSTNVENDHLGDGNSDWKHALDQMEASLPNVNTVCFVVSWFGDDLRIGNCTLRPKVESQTKRTDPISWRVAGLTRGTAIVISQVNDRPAYGGAPNDVSVYRAIQDLKSRGYEVMFYPFLVMDIPSDNTLPNPYSDNASETGQPIYPWRGRITCSPAPGYAGTVDKSAAAGTQVSNFLGTATAANFSGSEGIVNYAGTAEWSFRRFILHYAELCRQAGGVDYFCIGTEMVEANRVRSSAGTFPFVNGLVSLAAQVASLLPSAKLSYAADWSEYNCYRPGDGSGDVYFHLDPLWADSNIDFIGIDNYMKLSDWRDSNSHADYGDGVDAYGNPKGDSIYDLEYLKGQVAGGEDYDYFYASTADRVSQTRTAITDGAYGKPWVYRQKDLVNWWSNEHYNRPGGTESGTPTAWTPESKPIIMTEFGCPAINKGTNQPNVFYDPKSSESFMPYFSSGGRDDEIQRQYIRAFIEYWKDNSNNPPSGVYSGRMIDTSRMCYWSYDARPWPTFPMDGDAWADQENWQYGHWISGRIDTVYLPDLLNQLAEDYNVTADYDFSRAYGSCDGFVVQAKTSFRSTVEPLASLFLFDIIESGATIKAVSQQESRSIVTVTLDDIAEAQSDNDEPVVLTRSQSSELPVGMTIQYLDIFKDYEKTAVSQRREITESESEPSSETPVVLDYTRAQQIVDRLLYSAWARRTLGEFGLLPQFLYLEAGDVVTVDDGNFNKPLRIGSIADGDYRQITARSFDPGIFQPGGGASRTQAINSRPVSIAPTAVFMDLPILRSDNVAYRPYAAAYAKPWPGVNVYRSITDSNYGLDTTLIAPSVIGRTTDPFDLGITDVWDLANELKVEIFSDELSTLPEENVLNGGNALAIENSKGGWEIVQFVNAQLTGTRTYTLTKLLRGQLGTEDQMENALPAGARIVLLESTLQQLSLGINDINREYYIQYGPANRDIGDDLYQTVQRTFTGRGLRPYSPVHVGGIDEGSGNIRIFWTRRTRINGDSWDYIDDVPLNEAYERYEVDVLDGSDNVVRTLTVTDATSVVYTAAQQSTDGISSPFDIIVYQLSDQVGRGIGRRTTING